MFGNRKIREIVRKKTINEKMDMLYNNNKGFLFSYVLAFFVDIFVSLTVFRYSKEFFLNNEAGFLAKYCCFYYQANDAIMFWFFISLNILIFFIILIAGKLYIKYYVKEIKNDNSKFKKSNYISAHLVNIAIFFAGYMHIIGALSWLV